MRRFVPDWLIYLAIVLGILWYANREPARVVTPAPAPELGDMLPSESPRDRRIVVEVDRPRSGVGTAFAANTEGLWITARHVVDGCDEIGLKVDPRKFARVETVSIPPNADIALMRSRWARPPLPTDLTSSRQVGELGYFFGFPQGQPGEVVGKLMARGRMSVRGRYQTEEPVLIWSEVARTRGLLGSLGGLSGAPALDRDGELIGVVSAESPRRGRVYTVAPRSLRAVVPTQDVARIALDPERYPFAADQLRRERRVAQLVCIKR